MNKRFCMKGFLLIAAVCTVLLAVDAGAATGCRLTGVYFGEAGNTWMLTVSRGSSARAGHLYLEWIQVDPTAGGAFPTAVRATNGVGLWEKINSKNLKWSWVFYTLDANGAIVYIQRFSGTSVLVDCDHANDTWVVETWLGGQDMNTEPPIACAPGTGTETRMPLVQAVCQ